MQVFTPYMVQDYDPSGTMPIIFSNLEAAGDYLEKMIEREIANHIRCGGTREEALAHIDEFFHYGVEKQEVVDTVEQFEQAVAELRK